MKVKRNHPLFPGILERGVRPIHRLAESAAAFCLTGLGKGWKLSTRQQGVGAPVEPVATAVTAGVGVLVGSAVGVSVAGRAVLVLVAVAVGGSGVHVAEAVGTGVAALVGVSVGSGVDVDVSTTASAADVGDAARAPTFDSTIA